MHEAPIGTIGSIDVRLGSPTLEQQRYERRYVPVTPASREIPGDAGSVAPDTTVAQWHLNDWSTGEGDLLWKDRGRYNTSTGAGPASDGSGVTTNALYEQLTYTAGGAVMADAKILARAGGEFLTADDMGSGLYKWAPATSSWTSHWAIGGAGADNVSNIAAVTDTEIYVSEPTGTIREVKVAGTALHFAAWGSNPHIIAYGGQLYGLADRVDLYSIDTTAADTRTLVVDVGATPGRITGVKRFLTTSDVGPVWIVPLNDGTTYLYEYNQADDVGYVVGELPKDVQPYDLAFHSGIYFVSFRYAGDDSTSGDAWLYYQVGGQRGVAGPFRSTTGTTASKPVQIAGVVGDRLYVYYDAAVWAYDLSTGGISMAARGVAEPSASGFATFGADVHLATGTTSFRLDLDKYDTAVSAELTTGRFDFGYIGLNKTLTTVTVSVESALAASETVGVAYSVDGGAFTSATGTMVATETTKTWTISSNAATVRGVDFELKLLPKANTSASSPKVVSVSAEAVGAESRLEWILLLDVSDTNEQHGHVTVDGLKALKVARDVVSFSDPWQVLPHVAAETFDVTVEEVNLPDILPGGDPVAVVRLRSVATV